MDDAILYSSCFDANGGLFESILGQDDVIITDQLNHASIIDGIRLCKARRLIYEHSDMKSLEQKLVLSREGADIWEHTGLAQEPHPAKNILIATDGVFSMDGDIAKIDEIIKLADKYDALVMVDDSHATGFFGKTEEVQSNTVMHLVKLILLPQHLVKQWRCFRWIYNIQKEIVDMLRQRSRPYLFSNTLAPAIVGASIAAFDLLEKSGDLREKLRENTKHFREKMKALGFDLIEVFIR